VQLALAAAVALAGGAAAAPGAWKQLGAEHPTTPTARVARGDVTTDVYARGELRAPTTMMLTTPSTGGQMRILALKPTGAIVKAGDVVIALDPSQEQYRLDEQQSQLAEAEAEIAQVNANAAAQRARDRADLLIAQFNLQKAELDVSGNELLSAIEARKRVLTLEEARRRLTQLQEDITFHGKVNDAGMAAALQKQNKSRLLVEDAQETIAQMTLRAPIAGVVSVQSNLEGTYFIEGVPMPEYREGDTISSGRSVAEILDIASLELVGHVAETDTAWIRQGQHALITFHGDRAAPSADGTIDAIVTSIGGIRNPVYGDAPSPIRRVDVVLQLTKPLPSARPGLTARIVLKSDPLKGVLSVPRQAVFERDGQPHVYLETGDRFTLTPIKIVARTEASVVVQDLPEGAVVALSDSDAKTSEPATRAATPLNPRTVP
jgi:multidrug efflux pump subunit AcrA (membrane-fusion protein)